MKLSNQQVEALSESLAKELKTAYDNQRTDIKKGLMPKINKAINDTFKKPLGNVPYDILKTLSYCNSNKDVRDKLETYFIGKLMSPYKPTVPAYQIKQDIILASIEATDLDTLKSLILKKYSL